MRPLFAAIPLLLVLAACTEQAAGPPPDSLRGRTFLSTEVTEDGKPHSMVTGTKLSVQFTDDGLTIRNSSGKGIHLRAR